MSSGQVEETVVDEDWGHLTLPPFDLTTGVLTEGPGRTIDDLYCWCPTGSTAMDLAYESIGCSTQDCNGYIYLNETHRSWCRAADSYISSSLETVFNTTLSFSRYGQGTQLSNSTASEIADPASREGGSLFISGPGVFESSISAIIQSFTFGALSADEHISQDYSIVHGAVLAERTFVHVRWLWLILPALLNAIGIAFLIITVSYTRKLKLPLWKASAMAMLYHGLHEDLIQPGETYETASDMEEAARGVYVRFSSGDEAGGRSILRS